MRTANLFHREARSTPFVRSGCRRGLVLACLLWFSFGAGVHAQKATATPGANVTPSPDAHKWSYERYQKAFKESGRATRMTAAEFDAVQARKPAMLETIRQRLTKWFSEPDPRVMRAFQELPREYFHYNYQTRSDFSDTTYEFPSRTWALGWGSALSDYVGQAYMAQLAAPRPKDRVLEIGTGSGYNISLLSRMVKEAYSIEIIKPLGHAVSKVFKPLGYRNIHTRVGDGYYGWPEVKGGFDIIMFTCVAQFVPPPLFEQLRPGGRIIIPIGQPFKHDQVLYVYRKDRKGRVHSRKYIPVYFIPMKGAMADAVSRTGGALPGGKGQDPTDRPIGTPGPSGLSRPPAAIPARK